MTRWWHRRIWGHVIVHRQVIPPLWDVWATGDLWRCSCGRRWAR